MWVLPTETEECSHGAFYQDKSVMEVPECDSCGAKAIKYDVRVHGPVVIDDDLIVSRAIITGLGIDLDKGHD